MKNLTNNKIFLISSISIFAFFFILNLLSPLIGDDWTFKEISYGMASFIQSFMQWNARFYELLWRAWIVRVNPFVFDMINALVATAFVLLGFVFITGRVAKNLADCILIMFAISLFIVSVSFEEMFLWGSGSVNYLWSYVSVLCVLLPYRFFYSNAFHTTSIKLDILDSKGGIFVFAFVSFVAGMGHEIIATLVLMGHLILFIISFKFHIKLPKWYIVGFVCFALGFLLLYFAPGSASRIDTEITKYEFLSINELIALPFQEKLKRIYMSIYVFITKTPKILFFTLFGLLFFRIYNQVMYKNITLFLSSFALYAYITFSTPFLSFVLIIAMSGFVAYKSRQMQDYITFIGLLFWVCMGLVFIQFAKNLPFRVRIFDLIFLIGIISIYAKFYIDKYSHRVLLAIGGSIAIFFIFHIYQYIDIRLKWNALCEYAEKQKALYGDNVDIIYDRDKFNITYFGASGWWKFLKNNEGVNETYAKALGVRSFKIENPLDKNSLKVSPEDKPKGKTTQESLN